MTHSKIGRFNVFIDPSVEKAKRVEGIPSLRPARLKVGKRYTINFLKGHEGSIHNYLGDSDHKDWNNAYYIATKLGCITTPPISLDGVILQIDYNCPHWYLLIQPLESKFIYYTEFSTHSKLIIRYLL